MKRGEVWWASLPGPLGRRPVLIVQSNVFNASRVSSVVVASITSNLALEGAPGNVRLPQGEGGVPKASVVNVSQLFTIEKGCVTERLGSLAALFQQRVDAGLRLVLELPAGVGKPGVMEAAGEYLCVRAVKGRPRRTNLDNVAEVLAEIEGDRLDPKQARGRYWRRKA